MNENPMVSICIPTYEMKGKGDIFLEYSFSKIASQTYKNIEVVVSDHSTTDLIEKACLRWSDKINVKHYYNDKGRGMFPHNINNAIQKANGDIIKTLCQDDFLHDENSIQNQLFYFLNGKSYWLVTACCHTTDGENFYKPFYPVYHDNIQYGQNTISSPSVLMFKNEDVIYFDENLFWLVDVDYYKMLFDKHGLPSICNIISVVNREDETRVSNSITQDVMYREYTYVLEKYKNKN